MVLLVDRAGDALPGVFANKSVYQCFYKGIFTYRAFEGSCEVLKQFIVGSIREAQ
jgi:hypothetical protein